MPDAAADSLAVVMEGVEKYYGDFPALKAIDLTVARGERIVLCGPSGSGKSTLIRCINQLEPVQKGRIVVDGIELTAGPRNVERIRRDVGMVFQQFNLFPHMTVLENCTLAPIKVRGTAKAEAEETARRYLKRVRIPEQADKYPAQLSGGQQQRVAIEGQAASHREVMTVGRTWFARSRANFMAETLRPTGMIVRPAFFRGRIHAGREAEFRSFVGERLMPMWRDFPGVRDVRVQFALERDEGAAPIPLSLAMVFDNRSDLAMALAAPIRFESRAVTQELLAMFDGAIDHHVFELI